MAERLDAPTLSDEDVVERVRAGELALFEILLRRYDQRLYRAARAITGDDAEAEDVVQEAYVRAYANLHQFAGRASFATWLTRIAAHEAFARLRRRGRLVDEDPMPMLSSSAPGPEERASDRELAQALEAAIDALPAVYRTVFMLRDVEGLTTAETANVLGDWPADRENAAAPRPNPTAESSLDTRSCGPPRHVPVCRGALRCGGGGSTGEDRGRWRPLSVSGRWHNA